jgi:hypothetical protein
MRDEMFGRLWEAHHDELSLSIDRGLIRLRNGLARLANWDGTGPQLLAMAAASLITSVGLFTTTTSA